MSGAIWFCWICGRGYPNREQAEACARRGSPVMESRIQTSWFCQMPRAVGIRNDDGETYTLANAVAILVCSRDEPPHEHYWAIEVSPSVLTKPCDGDWMRHAEDTFATERVLFDELQIVASGLKRRDYSRG